MATASNPAHLLAKNRFGRMASLLVTILGPLLVGAIAAKSGSLDGLLLAAALGAALVFFLPSSMGLWLLFVLALLVVGNLVYFARIEKAGWFLYLMALIFMLKIPYEMLRADGQRPVYFRQIPGFLVGLALFLVLLLFSAVLNKTGVPWLLAVSKNYLFVWSVVFLVGLGAVAERSLERLWRFFLWVSVLQLPFGVVQLIYFAARPTGIDSWDAVVGTFGGDPDGGGGSGEMAFFLVFAMLLASSLYSAKRISATFHWTVLVCAMATIALAEVKIVFVILPIGYLWLFRKHIPHNLGRTLLAGTLLAIVLAGVFVTYKSTFYEGAFGRGLTVGSTIEKVMAWDTNPYLQHRPGDRSVSRLGALMKWWVLNPVSEPAQFLFGHGPGATRESRTLGAGEAARKYPFYMNTSTASVLLWEVGLSGYASFLIVLLFGAYRAERAARNEVIPGMQRCILQTNAAALLLIAPMTIYNTAAIYSPFTQFLIAAMLGHLFLMVRKYVPSSQGVASRTSSTSQVGSKAAHLAK